jgi:type IV secretion system protein VirD4
MAIVMQDIAQLDELYGKNTRITTVSGSQIKLFIQINDLETSEFVSEMLGETTQVYKTPVTRPGQGLFSSTAWAPHYTPRPLRSPLELREMSAHTSILMVKNSRSFELTKIRHYQDRPYRRLYEAAKGNPTALPVLHEWQDEVLGGAINPAPTVEVDEAVGVAEERPQAPAAKRGGVKEPRPKAGAKKEKAPAKIEVPPQSLPLPALPVASKAGPAEHPRKALSLGEAPKVPRGENCNIQDILAATEMAQTEDFVAMTTSIGAGRQSQKIQDAVSVLTSLEMSFGDDGKQL